MAAGEREGGRRSGRPGLVIGALVALALIFGGIAWALLQEPAPMQARRLPDGSWVRLEAVTFGRDHEFVRGPRWQRLLTPLLPTGLRDRIGVKVYPWRSGRAESLVFWMLRRDGTNPPHAPLPSIVMDEHGCQFRAFAVSGSHDMTKGETIEAHEVPAFPRRGKMVGLQISPPTAFRGDAALPQLEVANPASGKYPEWRAEPLPITRSEGDVAFTLTALLTHLEGPGPSLRPATPGGVSRSRASFRITEGGRPSDAWRVSRLTISDATGNLLLPDTFNQYTHEGQAHFAFERGLCVEEAAWKLRVEFARQKGFQRGDLWVARDVPITRQGRLVDSPARFTRHGVTLRLLGIAATGAQAPPGGAGMWDRPAAYVQAPGRLEGMQLALVGATDDRGRAVASTGTGLSGVGLHSFDLHAAPGARTVDLTFALQRSHFAEFVAKPSRLSVKAGR